METDQPESFLIACADKAAHGDESFLPILHDILPAPFREGIGLDDRAVPSGEKPQNAGGEKIGRGDPGQTALGPGQIESENAQNGEASCGKTDEVPPSHVRRETPIGIKAAVIA